jgi:hypothetical protein
MQVPGARVDANPFLVLVFWRSVANANAGRPGFAVVVGPLHHHSVQKTFPFPAFPVGVRQVKIIQSAIRSVRQDGVAVHPKRGLYGLAFPVGAQRTRSVDAAQNSSHNGLRGVGGMHGYRRLAGPFARSRPRRGNSAHQGSRKGGITQRIRNGQRRYRGHSEREQGRSSCAKQIQGSDQPKPGSNQEAKC